MRKVYASATEALEGLLRDEMFISAHPTADDHRRSRPNPDVS